MTRACWFRMYSDCHKGMYFSICFYFFTSYEYDSAYLMYYLKHMFVSVCLPLRCYTCGLCLWWSRFFAGADCELLTDQVLHDWRPKSSICFYICFIIHQPSSNLGWYVVVSYFLLSYVLIDKYLVLVHTYPSPFDYINVFGMWIVEL